MARFREKGEIKQGMIALIIPAKNRMKSRYPTLADMSQSEEEAEHVPEPTPPNQYPWGLRLHLGEAELRKLGLEELPDVGEVLDICAIAEVCGVNQVSTSEGKNRHVELQITHLGIEEDE